MTFARTRNLAIALALVVSGATTSCTGRDATVTIELSQAQIQQHLSERFPIKKRKLLTEIRLTSPVVTLRPDTGQVGLEIKISIDPPLLSPRSGSLGAAGLVAYRSDEKAFYIEAPQIEKIEIQGLDPDELDKSREPIQALITAGLQNFPVYQLTDRNLTELTAKHVLRSVSVQNGKLIAKLGLPL